MTQVWTKMLKETKQQLTLYSILDVYAKGQCHWPFGKQHLKLGQISRDFSVSKYLKQYWNQSSVSCSNNNKVTNKELVFFNYLFNLFMICAERLQIIQAMTMFWPVTWPKTNNIATFIVIIECITLEMLVMFLLNMNLVLFLFLVLSMDSC